MLNMEIDIRPDSPRSCDSADSFLQSAFWGEFKADFGWLPRHFSIGDLSEAVLGRIDAARKSILVLERGLAGPLGKGPSFAYVPDGPEMDIPENESAPFLETLSRALRPLLSKTCVFIRYDPPWFRLEKARAGDNPDGDVAMGSRKDISRPVIGLPLRRAAADIQPPDTVLMDLRHSAEDLLEAMKPKWRYNIRLAEKKGVRVREAGREAIALFYRMYEETATRDRIAIHPEDYYQRLFSHASGGGAKPKLDLRLWIASHDEDELASIVTLFRGKRAVYLYGASFSTKRSLMPAYALQWSAILAAKEAGCEEYDFYGIPPVDDPQHPMAGLYRFKTGFGGSVAHRAGSWDYPLRPLSYRIFRSAEAARTWYYKDFRKRAGRRDGEQAISLSRRIPSPRKF
jgi:lipid II:glycine glycyltransferase (peptidoglycan interpeptide bridge formation enzyme)